MPTKLRSQQEELEDVLGSFGGYDVKIDNSITQNKGIRGQRNFGRYEISAPDADDKIHFNLFEFENPDAPVGPMGRNFNILGTTNRNFKSIGGNLIQRVDSRNNVKTDKFSTETAAEMMGKIIGATFAEYRDQKGPLEYRKSADTIFRQFLAKGSEAHGIPIFGGSPTRSNEQSMAKLTQSFNYQIEFMRPDATSADSGSPRERQLAKERKGEIVGRGSNFDKTVGPSPFSPTWGQISRFIAKEKRENVQIPAPVSRTIYDSTTGQTMLEVSGRVDKIVKRHSVETNTPTKSDAFVMGPKGSLRPVQYLPRGEGAEPPAFFRSNVIPQGASKGSDVFSKTLLVSNLLAPWSGAQVEFKNREEKAPDMWGMQQYHPIDLHVGTKEHPSLFDIKENVTLGKNIPRTIHGGGRGVSVGENLLATGNTEMSVPSSAVDKKINEMYMTIPAYMEAASGQPRKSMSYGNNVVSTANLAKELSEHYGIPVIQSTTDSYRAKLHVGSVLNAGAIKEQFGGVKAGLIPTGIESIVRVGGKDVPLSGATAEAKTDAFVNTAWFGRLSRGQTIDFFNEYAKQTGKQNDGRFTNLFASTLNNKKGGAAGYGMEDIARVYNATHSLIGNKKMSGEAIMNDMFKTVIMGADRESDRNTQNFERFGIARADRGWMALGQASPEHIQGLQTAMRTAWDADKTNRGKGDAEFQAFWNERYRVGAQPAGGTLPMLETNLAMDPDALVAKVSMQHSMEYAYKKGVGASMQDVINKTLPIFSEEAGLDYENARYSRSGRQFRELRNAMRWETSRAFENMSGEEPEGIRTINEEEASQIRQEIFNTGGLTYKEKYGKLQEILGTKGNMIGFEGREDVLPHPTLMSELQYDTGEQTFGAFDKNWFAALKGYVDKKNWPSATNIPNAGSGIGIQKDFYKQVSDFFKAGSEESKTEVKVMGRTMEAGGSYVGAMFLKAKQFFMSSQMVDASIRASATRQDESWVKNISSKMQKTAEHAKAIFMRYPLTAQEDSVSSGELVAGAQLAKDIGMKHYMNILNDPKFAAIQAQAYQFSKSFFGDWDADKFKALIAKIPTKISFLQTNKKTGRAQKRSKVIMKDTDTSEFDAIEQTQERAEAIQQRLIEDKSFREKAESGIGDSTKVVKNTSIIGDITSSRQMIPASGLAREAEHQAVQHGSATGKAYNSVEAMVAFMEENEYSNKEISRVMSARTAQYQAALDYHGLYGGTESGTALASIIAHAKFDDEGISTMMPSGKTDRDGKPIEGMAFPSMDPEEPRAWLTQMAGALTSPEQLDIGPTNLLGATQLAGVLGVQGKQDELESKLAATNDWKKRGDILRETIAGYSDEEIWNVPLLGGEITKAGTKAVNSLDPTQPNETTPTYQSFSNFLKAGGDEFENFISASVANLDTRLRSKLGPVGTTVRGIQDAAARAVGSTQKRFMRLLKDMGARMPGGPVGGLSFPNPGGSGDSPSWSSPSSPVGAPNVTASAPSPVQNAWYAAQATYRDANIQFQTLVNNPHLSEGTRDKARAENKKATEVYNQAKKDFEGAAVSPAQAQAAMHQATQLAQPPVPAPAAAPTPAVANTSTVPGVAAQNGDDGSFGRQRKRMMAKYNWDAEEHGIKATRMLKDADYERTAIERYPEMAGKSGAALGNAFQHDGSVYIRNSPELDVVGRSSGVGGRSSVIDYTVAHEAAHNVWNANTPETATMRARYEARTEGIVSAGKIDVPRMEATYGAEWKSHVASEYYADSYAQGVTGFTNPQLGYGAQGGTLTKAEIESMSEEARQDPNFGQTNVPGQFISRGGPSSRGGGPTPPSGTTPPPVPPTPPATPATPATPSGTPAPTRTRVVYGQIKGRATWDQFKPADSTPENKPGQKHRRKLEEDADLYIGAAGTEIAKAEVERQRHLEIAENLGVDTSSGNYNRIIDDVFSNQERAQGFMNALGKEGWNNVKTFNTLREHVAGTLSQARSKNSHAGRLFTPGTPSALATWQGGGALIHEGIEPGTSGDSPILSMAYLKNKVDVTSGLKEGVDGIRTLSASMVDVKRNTDDLIKSYENLSKVTDKQKKLQDQQADNLEAKRAKVLLPEKISALEQEIRGYDEQRAAGTYTNSTDEAQAKAFKDLRKLRGEQRESDTDLVSKDNPDSMASFLRRTLGGFGIMYAKTIAGYMTTGMGQGQQERLAMETATMTGSNVFTGTQRAMSNQLLSYQNKIALNGQAYNPIVAAQTAIVENPALSIAANTAVSGLGAFAAMNYFEQAGLKGAAKLALPVAIGVGTINAVGQIYAGAQDPRGLGYQSSKTDRVWSNPQANWWDKTVAAVNALPTNLSWAMQNAPDKQKTDEYRYLDSMGFAGSDTDAANRLRGTGLSISGGLSLNEQVFYANQISPKNRKPSDFFDANTRALLGKYSGVLTQETAPQVEAFKQRFPGRIWTDAESERLAVDFSGQAGVPTLDVAKNVMAGAGWQGKLAYGMAGPLANFIRENPAYNTPASREQLLAGSSVMNQLAATKYFPGVGSAVQNDPSVVMSEEDKTQRLVEMGDKYAAYQNNPAALNALMARDKLWMSNAAVGVAQDPFTDKGINANMTPLEAQRDISTTTAKDSIQIARMSTGQGLKQQYYGLGQEDLGNRVYNFMTDPARPKGTDWFFNRMMVNRDPMTYGAMANSGINLGSASMQTFNGTSISGNYAAMTDYDMNGKMTGMQWGSSSLKLGSESNADVVKRLFGDYRSKSGSEAGFLKTLTEGAKIPGGIVMPDGSVNDSIGGPQGLAIQQSRIQWGFQQQSWGLQQAGINLNRAFTTGEGIGAYGFSRGAWGIEDAQIKLQAKQADWQYDFSKRQMNVENKNWQANFGLQMQGVQQQRGWTREDWGLNQQRFDLGWQWKKEIFQEENRFMTGRQRRLAERQMERDTTTHNLDQDQMDRSISRQQAGWKLEDQRFNLEKTQHATSLAFQRESIEKNREFYLDDKKLRAEQLKLSRTSWTEQQKLQQAQLNLSIQQATQAHEYEEFVTTKLNPTLDAQKAILTALVEGAYKDLDELTISVGKNVGILNPFLEEWNKNLEKSIALMGGEPYKPEDEEEPGGGEGTGKTKVPLAAGGSFKVPLRFGYEGFNLGGVATASAGEDITVTSSRDTALRNYANSMRDSESPSLESSFIPMDSGKSGGQGTKVINIDIGQTRFATLVLDTVTGAIQNG